MNWFGYAVLVLAMAGLTGTCFVFAVKEFLRPVDPGPLAVPGRVDTPGPRAEATLAAAGAQENGDLGVPILLRRGTRLPCVVAPLIRVEGAASAPHLPELDAAAEDHEIHLRALIVQGRPLDELVRVLSGAAKTRTSGVALLEHAERLGMLQRLPVRLMGWLAPTWLGSARGWYLGAGTARVHGSLRLPANSCVPFHLIVKGAIRADDESCFHGNVHATGDVVLGQRSEVYGSIVSTGAVRIGSLSVVRDCIGAANDVDIGGSSSVGTEISGGISSGGGVSLQVGTAVRNRVSATRGVACG